MAPMQMAKRPAAAPLCLRASGVARLGLLAASHVPQIWHEPLIRATPCRGPTCSKHLYRPKRPCAHSVSYFEASAPVLTHHHLCSGTHLLTQHPGSGQAGTVRSSMLLCPRHGLCTYVGTFSMLFTCDALLSVPEAHACMCCPVKLAQRHMLAFAWALARKAG